MSLFLSLAAALTACGGGGGNESDTAAVDGTASAEGWNLRSKTPAPAPAPAPAPVAATGTLTVSWAAPTLSADGLRMADLAGFRVSYGTAPGTYTTTIDIPNPSTLTYTISGLPSNTYYVVVKAYDSSDNESSASVEVSKAIQ